ncbi:MAG: phosphate ABC transporter substrate-binding protein [Opitutaceae bacterium]
MTTKSLPLRLVLFLLACLIINPVVRSADDSSSELPVYAPVAGVSGNLNSVGSDTLNNLLTLWAEAFQEIYPNVNIQIEGKGSSTAPPALIEGTAQLGPMSREMKASEVDEFERKFGYKPTVVRVAIDALAVFVHKDNPIESLSLVDLDGIFSSTHRLGSPDIVTWGQLKLDGGWTNRPISVYGRNSASGTYGFFKEVALGKGDYRPTVKEQPGSSAVVQGIASDLYGIGYSGIGYRTSGVKTVKVGADGGKPVEPDMEHCLSGDYPLARFLLIYVNKAPNEALDKLTYEFARFINSRQGQEIVSKIGYFPLPAEVAEASMDGLK